MNHEPRFATDDDLDGIWEVFRLGFGLRAAERDRWMPLVDPERCLVVEGNRGEIAAASNIRTFGQWFGRRAVKLGGYSPVAVLPEHRGRGLGQAVTSGHFEDMRRRGEVIAGLFPASVEMYRKVGFEVAGSYVRRRIPAAHLAALAPAPSIDVRRGTENDLDAVVRCHNRFAGRIDGALVRDHGMWAMRMPEDLDGLELYVVDAPERPGEVDGYGAYRMTGARPPYDYSITVSEVIAADGETLRALWRVVGSSGTQAPDVFVVGPGEDPLFLLLGQSDPAAVKSEIRWMLRLVDAAGAVAARGWNPAVTGRAHIDVTDRHAPWNHGRWVLEVADGEGRLTPGGNGTLQLDIAALSSWWAGYASARTLANVGAVVATDANALAVLDGIGAGSPPSLVDFY